MIYSRRCQYSHSLWLPENAKPVISYNKNLFVKSTILCLNLCTTTGHQGCYFTPDKSYGRSVSDMKSVRSLIVPSLHIGILPQELNLEKWKWLYQ